MSAQLCWVNNVNFFKYVKSHIMALSGMRRIYVRMQQMPWKRKSHLMWVHSNSAVREWGCQEWGHEFLAGGRRDSIVVACLEVTKRFEFIPCHYVVLGTKGEKNDTLACAIHPGTRLKFNSLGRICNMARIYRNDRGWK